jgi:hypothetical protein
MSSHRPGKLKQENKKHKLRGKTRPSREHALAGRIEKKKGAPPGKNNPLRY